MVTVRIVINPRDDSQFARLVERLGADATSPRDLEQLLRSHYGDARVSEGVEDSGQVRWYAYRDGRWKRV